LSRRGKIDVKVLQDAYRGGRVERILARIAPRYAEQRAISRTRMAAASMSLGGFDGASRKGRHSNYNPTNSDTDSILTWERDTLVGRSHDLYRNSPIARGAIETKSASVIGTGLRLHSRPDREYLGLDDKRAEAFENAVERYWRLWFGTTACDSSGTQTGSGIFRTLYRAAKLDGDGLCLLPYKERDDSPVGLKLQVVDAARLSNKDNQQNTATRVDGIEKDEDGRPVKYHILNVHPGNFRTYKGRKWSVVDAFGKDGRRNIIHFYRKERPGQSRGVPELAPVIGMIKQLTRATEAEIDAAVINAFFAVVFSSEDGGQMNIEEALDGELSTVASGSGADDIDIGPGTAIQTPEKTKVDFVDPKRPNLDIPEFIEKILKQIGMALSIPYEILTKHFASSYSASRAAMLEAWRHFEAERAEFVELVAEPVYFAFLDELVARGLVSAPGYFADPVAKAAWRGCEFIGPPRGMIDETKEVKAAAARIDANLSDHKRETALLTGRDWDLVVRQKAKEKKQLQDAELIETAPATGGTN